LGFAVSGGGKGVYGVNSVTSNFKQP
jgi:hypothetical protein